jgi:predicted nucleic acid-binding Zn ribbon protein
MVNKKPRKNCIICEGEIIRSTNSRSIALRRGNNAVTCSKKCAKIYNRVSRHVYNKFYSKERKR